VFFLFWKEHSPPLPVNPSGPPTSLLAGKLNMKIRFIEVNALFPLLCPRHIVTRFQERFLTKVPPSLFEIRLQSLFLPELEEFFSLVWAAGPENVPSSPLWLLPFFPQCQAVLFSIDSLSHSNDFFTDTLYETDLGFFPPSPSPSSLGLPGPAVFSLEDAGLYQLLFISDSPRLPGPVF